MKFLSLIILLIISANCDNNENLNGSVKRKLLSYIENNSTESWSELFANFITNNFKTFKQKNEIEPEKVPNDNVGKILSCVFKVFKTYIYDKLTGKPADVQTQADVKIEVIEDKRVVKANSNPKDDVEVIEPRYHGKLKEPSLCPEGSIKDANENCVEVKPSKFIVSVPNQCPIGYKPDWLGFCRPKF